MTDRSAPLGRTDVPAIPSKAGKYGAVGELGNYNASPSLQSCAVASQIVRVGKSMADGMGSLRWRAWPPWPRVAKGVE